MALADPSPPPIPLSQLIYLQKHPKGYIHSVYASTEALLYTNQLDKLILSIDLQASSMSFVTKAAVLKDLGLSEDQFLDVGLISGCDLTPSMPPLVPGGWRAVVDIISKTKSGVNAISLFPNDHGMKELFYPELFIRARCAIKFALVLTSEEGKCTPLPLALAGTVHPIVTAGDVPLDLHDIFSHRLPDEVYFHICRGLISPQLIGWLSSGIIVEQPPLDNGESTEYKRFIKEVITEGATAPRCTALGLVSSSLNKFWPKVPIVGAACCPPPPLPVGPAFAETFLHDAH